MNIFVTDPCPTKSAQSLPDKHIVKMPVESCQMLATIASSKWGHGFGTIPKADGTPYRIEHGAFRNHPCTQWGMEREEHWNWLIRHGFALCNEYTYRYGKEHKCIHSLEHATKIFPLTCKLPRTFARAMPEELKYDKTITTPQAYQLFIKSKGWPVDNYKRRPERKPKWL